MARDLNCGLTIPIDPKDTFLGVMMSFSSYSSLDLETFRSRTLIAANSLTRTLWGSCNFRIYLLVSSLPVRIEISVMALLPHAWSPIAPIVFSLLCDPPTQSLTSWFPTWLIKSGSFSCSSEKDRPDTSFEIDAVSQAAAMTHFSTSVLGVFPPLSVRNDARSQARGTSARGCQFW